MTKHELLNNITHKDLKVITRHSPDYGDNVNLVMTFPTEFADIQREYPILLRKNAKDGQFQALALLGLEKDDNLFLDEHGWHASYIPGMISRGPFSIGFQEQQVDGEYRKEPVVHVDMDDPRVNETQGEAVFLEHGGNSPYLERVSGILQGIHEGMRIGSAMFAAFAELELLEPVNLEMQVATDKTYKLNNFYTVSEERLAALPGASLEKLNRAGFLQGAFLLVASLSNVSKIITMQRSRLMNR